LKKSFYRINISKLLLVLFLFCSLVYSQDHLIRENSFYYPHSLNNSEIIQSLGIATAKLPEDVVETDDVFRAPLFSYRIKYGLPKNFIAEGSVESNLITYHFALGGKWNHEFGKFSLSAGSDIAFWFGGLNQFGFDTKIDGWHVYPNLSVGYTFPNFSVSLKSELLFILAQSTRNGDIKTENTFDTFSGYSFGLYFEQPLWKDNFVVIGFKSNFTKFYYPLWAGFSTFDRFFYIPEFVFSFNL
jgi:hypothetical protein